MTVWKAKKLFTYSYYSAGAVLAVLFLIFFTLPRQYVDAVIDKNKSGASAGVAPEEKEYLLKDSRFVGVIEAAGKQSSSEQKNLNTKPVNNSVPTSPETRWKQEVVQYLKLNGVYLSDNPADSFAAIVWKQEEEQFYAPGEEIPETSGIKVVAVFSDYIEVGKSGGKVKVELQTMDVSQSSTHPNPRNLSHPGRDPRLFPTKNDPDPERNSMRSPRTTGRSSSSKKFKPRKIGSNRYVVSREQMKPYFSNPTKLLTEMSVKPQTENGEPTGGFIITGMKQEALLRKVGLRDGDVVLRVNGQNPMNLINTINDSSLKEVQVEFLRAGRRQTLHYTIQN